MKTLSYFLLSILFIPFTALGAGHTGEPAPAAEVAESAEMAPESAEHPAHETHGWSEKKMKMWAHKSHHHSKGEMLVCWFLMSLFGILFLFVGAIAVRKGWDLGGRCCKK